MQVWNKSCLWAALLKFWFRTDLGRENSTGFYMPGMQSLLTFLTVTRWSRSTSTFYVLIGQNLTGECMRKIYTASWNLLTIAEADRVLCHLVMFKTVFFPLMHKMKHSCYQDCSVIHAGLFIDKCTACQSHWKSDFGWHRFQKWAYSLVLAWGVRGLKILEHLMTFRSSISTGKSEKLLSSMCFFFGFLKSSVWFMRLKFIHEQLSNLQQYQVSPN